MDLSSAITMFVGLGIIGGLIAGMLLGGWICNSDVKKAAADVETERHRLRLLERTLRTKALLDAEAFAVQKAM